MKPASLALLGLLLAGCATTAQTVVTDTFCTSPASRKRIWNPDTDTVATMREAVIFNRYIDLRCGYPGKTSQPVS
jgi:hypothetical protein